ncbi:hypothetical protein MAR_032620 [Mya arenaria]|uniref:Uncharacterized protein n=1 Tax=Mya arenaria TaxID=6604 RepID=A0ABY7FFJ9_MYAAR|nr:hypothetical protein MAR_032570 [Mya arenaria]WAR18026.1 hypothetical protein MAR_032620 [Mya arenaria]
MLRNLRVLTIT